MKVEFRLKELLGRYGQDYHGVIGDLANWAGVNRHTIARLYNDRATSVSFVLLSRLCSWMAEKGIPADELPGGLFGAGRAPLWNTMARQGGEVTIYLGEYQPISAGEVTWRWISRRDSTVASELVQQLSSGTEGGTPAPRLNFRYLPFRYSPADHVVDAGLLNEDMNRTREVFRQTQQNPEPGTAIIIGSQRVNYLLEFFVADLFGCKPFTPSAGPPSVPFFSVYRQSDQNTPSCFGGTRNPFQQKDSTTAGLHYLNDRGNWVVCPWAREEQDAGVVIAVNDHRRKSITLALFGFSGRATEAIGRQLVGKEDLFWPPTLKRKNREVGVFICRLTYTPSESEYDSRGDVQMQTCEVTRLEEKTLDKFVH
ncbi:MAG: helix-turn-helix transcriptional regulator [Planctomycetota bacterium]|nr:helix-turn-helix transcriptional regulator [Planctomycetota bacterium]